MSDLSRTLESLTTEEDWEAMAVHAGIPASELKSQIHDAVVALADEDSGLENFKLSEVRQEGGCATQDFDVSLLGIVGIKGSLKVCGSSITNWTAQLSVCLTVNGNSVRCETYTFGPHNRGVCYSWNVALAKAKLCYEISIHGTKICLSVNGRACYWKIYDWSCTSVDKTLLCISIPL